MRKDKKNTSTFPKLENLILECIGRLATDWPKLLNCEVRLEFDGFECIPFAQIASRVTDNTTLLEINLSGEHNGKFYLMFAYREAVIISGSILMESKEDIQKHISDLQLNEEYTDAFREFGNQSTASFDNIFRSHVSEEMHDKFSRFLPPPIDQGKLNEIFSLDNEQYIFIVNSRCSIGGFEGGMFALLFPLDIAESFFNETVIISDKDVFAHILVVDDSKTDSAIIKRYLRNSGYHAYVVQDGVAAFTAIQHERIDVVLLDIHLPKDDGFVVCRRIKRNMLSEHIPIVMCSTAATKENVINSIKAGAVDFLVKPFDRDRLIFKLEKYIKRKPPDALPKKNGRHAQKVSS